MPVEMPALAATEIECPARAVTTDPSVVSVLWMVPGNWPNLDEVVRTFEEQYPKIHVALYQVAPADYYETSRQLLARGCNMPDLLNIRVEQSAYFAAYGWLASLWNQYTFDQKEDWIQALRKSGRYNQELYSAPFSTSTSLLYFNRDLFIQAGVKLPAEEERWTWEKVIEAAQKLTRDENQDGSPELWGFAWEDQSPYQLLPLAESLGGSPIHDDGLTVMGVIDSPAWVEAFAFYGKVFNEWKVSPREDSFQAVEAFEEGKLAILVGRADLINQFGQVDFDWGVGRYPYFKKGALVLPTGDWQLAVNAKSTRQPEAMTLLIWLTTTPGGTALWQTGNISLPAEKTVLKMFAVEPELAEPSQAYWKLAANEAQVFTLPGPITPFFAIYNQRLEEAFQKIRLGADAKSSLTEAAGQLAEEMK
jgi:multiple sugar transport system substrate-binding protein